MLKNNRSISIILICGMLLVAIMAAGCTQNSQSAPDQSNSHVNTTVKFVDSNGNEVTLPKTADRIVATNADCAEMLIAIGAKDKIVGVTDTVKSTPLLMAQLPGNISSIGNWQTPSVETIMSLKPDVVICYSYASKPKNIDQLNAANLTIIYLDCYKMSTLSHDARALGTITGNTNQAEDYAQFLEKYQNMVTDNTSKLSAAQKPSVYWESYTEYSTVGNTSGGDVMISMAGGVNVAAANASLYASAYPKINSEWVIKNNPSYALKMISPTNVTSMDNLKKLQETVVARPGMDKADAVKNGHVYVMSGTVAFGPRAVIGLLYTAKILHPDLYKDVDPRAVMSEYSHKYLPGADQGYFIYPALS